MNSCREEELSRWFIGFGSSRIDLFIDFLRHRITQLVEHIGNERLRRDVLLLLLFVSLIRLFVSIYDRKRVI